MKVKLEYYEGQGRYEMQCSCGADTPDISVPRHECPCGESGAHSLVSEAG